MNNWVEREEIYQKLQNIVAKNLEIQEQEIGLDFPLFSFEVYDIRGKLYDSRVIDFKPQESEYYSWQLIAIKTGNTSDGVAIAIDIELEFELENIADEILFELDTVEKAIEFIYQKLNRK
jgi:acyl carrier protein